MRGCDMIISHVIPAPKKLFMFRNEGIVVLAQLRALFFVSSLSRLCLERLVTVSGRHEVISCAETNGPTLEGMNGLSMDNVYFLCLKIILSNTF